MISSDLGQLSNINSKYIDMIDQIQGINDPAIDN